MLKQIQHPLTHIIHEALLESSINKYIDFLHFCESPNADDSEFHGWISKLPDVLKIINSHRSFENVWIQYNHYVQRKFHNLSPHITELQTKLQRLHWCENIDIRFAPNLLQSKLLTDFVMIDHTLFVISACFSDTTVIHEYLHIVLKQKRMIFLDILQHHDIAQFVDIEKMFYWGYMTDDSEKSKVNALEDCIIRALCGILSSTNIGKYCEMNYESGFVSVPQLIHNLKEIPISDITLEELLYKIVAG